MVGFLERSHPLDMVPTQSPAGVKFVVSTGPVRRAGGYLASKAFVRKEQDGVMCRLHLPSNIYRLSLPHLPKGPRLALKRSFCKLLWRKVCFQRLRNGSLDMPDL